MRELKVSIEILPPRSHRTAPKPTRDRQPEAEQQERGDRQCRERGRNTPPARDQRRDDDEDDTDDSHPGERRHAENRAPEMPRLELLDRSFLNDPRNPPRHPDPQREQRYAGGQD